VRITICIGTEKYYSTDIDEREHAILHVGTWSDKNLATTVDAFRIASQNDPQLRLYIVGDMNWSLPQSVISRVEQKTKKRITCLGQISREELKKLVSKVKATCVPSTYKVPVLSPTVLESLASGTPVIGSSSGISRDILIHHYNGFRVNPVDSSKMADTISMLTKDNELLETLSKNALNLIKSFDSSVVAREYINLYNQI
jgi:glycosyltransferase involved in cell wall biosynthesis